MTPEIISEGFSILGCGVGTGFGLYCLFSLLSYAIRELFKLFKH